ncbi:MAG: hypothetical protein K2X77_33660 [Candidatus Obscuribacterales bacterium]|jgi:cold shock CspA family protein|nr:hypothetical protein [Candidatus Obscuribacterales bacterium]
MRYIPSRQQERQRGKVLWYNAGRGSIKAEGTGQTHMFYANDLWPGTADHPREGDKVEFQMHGQVYGRVIGVKVVERAEKPKG